MANEEDFRPIESMPSFKGEVAHKKKPRKEKKAQKKMTWNYRFWEKEKSKPQRGRKVQEIEQAKAEKVERVKVERKPISLSNPVFMALLTLYLIILGLLVPATLALCRSVTYLAETAENTLRRIEHGNTKQN